MQLNKLNWQPTHKIRNIDDIPKFGQKQFAFFGASNCGKSSLINYLSGRNRLTETSSKPGKTKSLNFYLVNNRIFVVDLPGHSYAIRSKKIRSIWEKLIIEYLTKSDHLSAIFYLFDAKRELKNNDLAWLDLFDQIGIKYYLVMTKTDKIKKSQITDKIDNILKEQSVRPAMDQQMLTTSVIDDLGRKEISKIIDKIYHGSN